MSFSFSLFFILRARALFSFFSSSLLISSRPLFYLVSHTSHHTGQPPTHWKKSFCWSWLPFLLLLSLLPLVLKLKFKLNCKCWFDESNDQKRSEAWESRICLWSYRRQRSQHQHGNGVGNPARFYRSRWVVGGWEEESDCCYSLSPGFCFGTRF